MANELEARKSVTEEGEQPEHAFIKASDAWESAMYNLEARLKGEIFPISTGWDGIDMTYFNGFETGWQIAIGGTSGAGKTGFASQMLQQMAVVNDFPLAFLIFSFEMRPERLLHRMVCNHYGMTMRQLLGVSRDADANITMKQIKDITKKKIPFFEKMSTFVERPLYPMDIREHILFFRDNLMNRGGYPEDMPIVIIIDHILLAKGTNNRTGIESLIHMQNDLKKEDPNLVLINLAQLNRNADTGDRFDPEKPGKHYPIKSDIFGADAIFQTCDSVMVLSNPSKGGLPYYGPDKLHVRALNDNPYIFCHHLKNRDAGAGGTITDFEMIGEEYKFIEAYGKSWPTGENDNVPFD